MEHAEEWTAILTYLHLEDILQCRVVCNLFHDILESEGFYQDCIQRNYICSALVFPLTEMERNTEGWQRIVKSTLIKKGVFNPSIGAMESERMQINIERNACATLCSVMPRLGFIHSLELQTNEIKYSKNLLMCAVASAPFLLRESYQFNHRLLNDLRFVQGVMKRTDTLGRFFLYCRSPQSIRNQLSFPTWRERLIVCSSEVGRHIGVVLGRTIECIFSWREVLPHMPRRARQYPSLLGRIKSYCCDIYIQSVRSARHIIFGDNIDPVEFIEYNPEIRGIWSVHLPTGDGEANLNIEKEISYNLTANWIEDYILQPRDVFSLLPRE